MSQFGPHTAHLTSNRNQSGFPLYSKWPGLDFNPKPGNASLLDRLDNHMESNIAAVFRGVAYGMSTQPSTSTVPPPTSTHTTTTSQKPAHPVTRNHVENEPFLPSIGLMPKPKHAFSLEEDDANKKASSHPVQHQYIESPLSDPEISHGQIISSKTTTPIPSIPVVVKSGVSVNEATWLSQLGKVWHIHIYSVASVFSLLAVMALYCLARIQTTTHLLPKGYYITIHSLVFLAAFFRCVIFFHDPYAAEQRLPSALSSVLFNTGMPCITTALSVLVLGLLRSAQITILPLGLQSPLAVAIASGLHIGGSVIVDVIAGVYENETWSAALWASVQALTAGWSGALCLAYIVVYIKIEQAAMRQRAELVRLTFTRVHLENASLSHRLSEPSLSRGARLTLVAAISGLLLAVLQVYNLMSVDGTIQIPPPQPWLWFGFQTCTRILEVLMWTLVCIASALPVNMTHNNGKLVSDDRGLLSIFGCKSCANCGSCSDIDSCTVISEKKQVDEMYPTICQSNQIVRNFTLHADGKTIPHDFIPPMDNQFKYNTTNIQPNKKFIKKSATLHAGSSENHFLVTRSDNFTSNTSRPSSMLLSEDGFVRFRTQIDPQQEIIHVLSRSSHNLEKQCNQDEGFMIKTHNPRTKFEYDDHIYSTTPRLGNRGVIRIREYKKPDDFCDSNNIQNILQNEQISDVCSTSVQDDPTNRSENSCNINEYSNADLISNTRGQEDWGRYASTCSSVSAANSFDVRMFDDYDVSSFYQSPSMASSTGSSHVYASLRKTNNKEKTLRHKGHNDHPIGVHNSDLKQSADNTTTLLTPRIYGFSIRNIPRRNNQKCDDSIPSSPNHFCSDSDQYSTTSRPYDDIADDEHSGESPIIRRPSNHASKQKWSHNHESTPDSAIVLEYLGHTDGEETLSCDGSDYLDRLQDQNSYIPNSQSKGLLSKIVTNNFVLSNGGYSPLSSEDACVPLMQPQERIDRKTREDKTRPCGHRPRKNNLNSPPSASTASKAVQYNLNQQMKLNKQIKSEDFNQQFDSQLYTGDIISSCPTSYDAIGSHDEDEEAAQQQSLLNHSHKERGDKRINCGINLRHEGSDRPESSTQESGLVTLSPSSSRCPSSVGSHSDLPSECVDSDDDYVPGETSRTVGVRWSPMHQNEPGV